MNKTAWKNRILALLLAVFMTVGVFPVQAFAEDDSPVVVVPETQQTEVADGTDKQLAGEDEQDNKAEDTDKDTEEKPADSSDTANESEEDDTTKPAEDTDIQSGDIPDEKDKDADHEQKDAAEEHSETLDGKEAAKSEESSDAEDPSDGKESSDAEKPSDDTEQAETACGSAGIGRIKICGEQNGILQCLRFPLRKRKLFFRKHTGDRIVD